MSSTPVLHFELKGNPSGPAVVFLHGFMGSTKDWDAVMSRLAKSCHCLAIDLPGHGKSTGLIDEGAYTFAGAASMVVEVMVATGVIPAAVVGYSMGGRLAISLALRYRHTCSRLIVESATPGIRGDRERKQRKVLDEERANELEQDRFEDFLRTWYRQPVFDSLAGTPERLEKMVLHRVSNNPGELARALRGMGVGAQPSLWDKLSRLAVPVLLLAGQRDGKYVLLVESMAALLPNGKVAIVPDVGHNVHWENPCGFADHIKDFVCKE